MPLQEERIWKMTRVAFRLAGPDTPRDDNVQGWHAFIRGDIHCSETGPKPPSPTWPCQNQYDPDQTELVSDAEYVRICLAVF